MVTGKPTRWTTRVDVIWRKVWSPVRAILSRRDKADKWERIEAHFHHACALESTEQRQYLERLREECESDYREVAALLPFAHERLRGIPPAEEPKADGPRLQENDILGEYRIIRLLGQGAVGEVYLAQDPELPRKVALKVLSKRIVSDDLIERFKREARAVSALNHPYILTIHYFKQLGDLHYIVTEYVEGRPLREHIGNLSQEHAMEYARQIGEALKAAHAAGIVHRDIKPENIMVHPNGYVKVLDFGLAKPTGFEGSFPVGGEGATHPMPGPHSEPGMLMGTLSYMSPEHLRGEKAGPSSDIWSWGVVLYEMLCGNRPFTGLVQSDVMEAILSREPAAPSRDNELNRLVSKALCKDPGRRYKSVTEAIKELERIQARARDASFGLEWLSATWEWTRKWRREILALALLVLTITGFHFVREYFPGRQFRVTGVDQLTELHNVVKAAISPDEKLIAFTTQEVNGQKLWIRERSSEAAAKEVYGTDRAYTGITFAPDAQSLYYVLRQDEVGNLYRIPRQGGMPRMVLGNVDSSITFSPDGTRFAFLRRDSANKRSFLVTKGLEVSPEATQVTMTAPDYFWTAPVWSGDGCCLLFGVLNDSGVGPTSLKIMSVDLSNGRQQVIGPQPWYRMGQPVWSKNGHALIVPATGNGANRSQLLEVSWPRGEISALIHDENTYYDLESGREQANLATVQEVRRSQPWIVTMRDGTARPIPGLSGTFYGAAWTPTGEVISQTDAGGHPDLWAIDATSGSWHALTHDASVEEDPAASGDGRHILYASNADGAFHIWLANSDGTGARRLTEDGSREEEGTFTPDSSRVIYTSIREGLFGAWMAPVNGGALRQITSHAARKPSVSPNGQFIVCDYVDDPKKGWITTVLDASSGKPVRFIDSIPAGDNALPVHWSADGLRLIYALTIAGISNLWEQPAFDGGLARQVTHFGGERIFAFAPSPDGRSVACIRGVVTSDVAVVHVTKQESMISIYKGVKMTILTLEILFILAVMALFLSVYRKKANKSKDDDGGGNDGAGPVTPGTGTGPHGVNT